MMSLSRILMLIREILTIRFFFLTIRIPEISIRILVISLKILVGCSCQLFLTRAHAHILIVKQTFILHPQHPRHYKLSVVGVVGVGCFFVTQIASFTGLWSSHGHVHVWAYRLLLNSTKVRNYLDDAQPAGNTIVHLPFIVEGGADGCAELCVFGDMEVDVIEAFQHGIDFFALG